MTAIYSQKNVRKPGVTYAQVAPPGWDGAVPPTTSPTHSLPPDDVIPKRRGRPPKV